MAFKIYEKGTAWVLGGFGWVWVNIARLVSQAEQGSASNGRVPAYAVHAGWQDVACGWVIGKVIEFTSQLLQYVSVLPAAAHLVCYGRDNHTSLFVGLVCSTWHEQLDSIRPQCRV